jgi:hypothetical protein
MRVIAALVTVVLSREPVVTAEDRQLAVDVKEKKDAICGLLREAPMTDEDRESIKGSFATQAGVDADGGHLFEDFLRNMDPEASTDENIQNHLVISQADVAARTQGAYLAFLLTLFMFFCYHQICCRCCLKSKDTAGCSTQWKGGFSFCSGSAAFAVLIAVFVAPAGRLDLVHGRGNG